MSSFECCLSAWQLVNLLNLIYVTFYNFIVYFLFLLSFCDFSLKILKVLCYSCHLLINYTFQQRLVLVMPHPDDKYHFGLWSTFPSCSLNCCWQFTLVTFFGELSWGTCSCFAWGAASRQWLPMWWYESPLLQGEKTLVHFFTVFHKIV